MNWMFWKKKSEEAHKDEPKSKAREWWDAVLFAVIAATLIRWLIMEAYTIPTPSMENSLLVGDFLFVSKFHYGTRTTTTPLQIPLTHQKIWFTNLPSYLEWIKLGIIFFNKSFQCCLHLLHCNFIFHESERAVINC